MNLEKLAAEFKNGNKSAFDTLYKETKSYARIAIYTYVQDPDTIEDLLQDTYMKVCNRMEEYQAQSFRNWVYTIAKNTALDYYRTLHTVPLSDEFEMPDAPKNPYLRFALNHLSEMEREVFLLKVLCGHTTKKISVTLNLKAHEVNQIYYEAKKKLKEMLGGVNDEIESV